MAWINILIGIVLITITIFIHSMVTKFAIQLAKRAKNSKPEHVNEVSEIWVAMLVLIMFFASLLESSVWAGVYLLIDAIPTFEKALYFSIVTFTTLGYGDVILPEQWNLLASIEAAIGIIVFGWSTAIVMAVVQKLYFGRS